MQIEPAENFAERERVLGRMVEYFRTREGVQALFVSGSLAAGTADAWSDIDFRVVVVAERHAAFLAERETAPATWGELLFNQVRPGTLHSVSHFRPFFKVDTFYYRPEHLVPSPWYTLPVRVLFDPEGRVEAVIRQSAGLEFVPTAAQVEETVRYGLAAAHEGYRRAVRGELCYAEAILNELREAILDADDFLNARPWYRFSHFESRADPEVVAAIHGSYCPLEREALLGALGRLVELFGRQVEALYRRFSHSISPVEARAALEALNGLPSG